MKKMKVPRLRTDEEAEAFLEQDLSDLDFSQFKPMRFEFEPKGESINIRVSAGMLSAVRSSAERRGIPYQRYIRQAIEHALAREPQEATAAARKTTRRAKAAARAGK
jgi:predicted DNA binding CopG/RHH family protein